MTIHVAAAFLQCFDEPSAPQIEEAPPPESLDAPDPAQQLAADFERLRAELEAACAQTLQQERETHAAALRAAREAWVREEGSALAATFVAGLQDGFDTLRSDVARILAPFVSSRIAARALNDLVDSLHTATRNVDAPVIRMTGPRDLIERLRLTLAQDDLVIAAEEREGVDMRIEIGPTLIETRLEDWMRSLTAQADESQ